MERWEESLNHPEEALEFAAEHGYPENRIREIQYSPEGSRKTAQQVERSSSTGRRDGDTIIFRPTWPERECDAETSPCPAPDNPSSAHGLLRPGTDAGGNGDAGPEDRCRDLPANGEYPGTDGRHLTPDRSGPRGRDFQPVRR